MPRRSLSCLGFAILCVTTSECAPSRTTCSPAGTCTAQAVCGAGPCQLDAGPPSLAKTRRLVFDPIDVGYVERGSGAPPGDLPTTATLGQDGRSVAGAAAVLVRYLLPEHVDVVAAYLDVDRIVGAQGDGVSLHAEQIGEPWDARRLTWQSGPAFHEGRCPSTPLRGGGPLRVRLDVTCLFRDRADSPTYGFAIVADHGSVDGAELVLVPGFASPPVGDPREPDERDPAAATSAPRLELYVR